MGLLIKAVPTGRKDKQDERRSQITVAGVKLTIIECDVWEGGVPDEGIHQQYHRTTWIEAPEVKWVHSNTAEGRVGRD